jgi:hypothetical protein
MSIRPPITHLCSIALLFAAAAPLSALADPAPTLSTTGGVDFALNPFNDWYAGQTARIGGRLAVSAPALVTYRFSRSEAVFDNGFTVGGETVFRNATRGGEGGGVERSFAVAAGLLDFGFKVPEGAVRFLSNATSEAGRLPGVGLMMLGERSARILLEDYGWLDADYDDMVVEVTVSAIPEPAEWMFMAAGLLFAAGVARRSARSSVHG